MRKLFTSALILLISIMSFGFMSTKANAFELKELDLTVHTGKVVDFQGLQDSVSDWHRLSTDLNIKAEILEVKNILTLGVIVQPSMNFSEDLHIFHLTSGAYINPFNSKHVELYYKNTDAYDTRNKLNQDFSFDNNEIGIKIIFIRN